LYSVEISALHRDHVTCRIISREKAPVESPLKLRLGVALIKGNRFDGALHHLVELGVHSVVPLITERCVAKVSDPQKKVERWQTIAGAAAKQCGRVMIPQVGPDIQSLETFCRGSGDFELKIIFWENATEGIQDLRLSENPVSAAVVTGPEGGFTSEEVESAKHSGFKALRLGPRILRAETAPIAVLSILQNLWGDLK
jgi:16S rRNA (uracil1498-N3)-methyltransferase